MLSGTVPTRTSFQELGDELDARRGIERVEGYVTEIRDGEAVERRRARGHEIRPQQARLGSDGSRPVAGAWTIRGSDVERHSHEGNVETVGAFGRREAHHRCRPSEARHFVSPERPRSIVHGVGTYLPTSL
jgi:hypothetical protein